MFTVGIFTTHIPYVAFVVFYAYFLIFGVEKASKGEINTQAKSITAEYQVTNYVNTDNVSNYYYNQANTDAFVREIGSLLLKPRIMHWERVSSVFHYFDLVSSLSNRPPPSFN
ncbi:MAG TPA: hypothetical protein PK335_03805 [Draconibacterium sp.]|nr:hypothetical protein [Draconibacterium sp.]